MYTVHVDDDERLRNIPEFVMVENVRGFDCSAARQRLVDVLTGLQFTIQVTVLTVFIDRHVQNNETKYRHQRHRYLNGS